jgi:hypothetical protein
VKRRRRPITTSPSARLSPIYRSPALAVRERRAISPGTSLMQVVIHWEVCVLSVIMTGTVILSSALKEAVSTTFP